MDEKLWQFEKSSADVVLQEVRRQQGIMATEFQDDYDYAMTL